MAFQDQTEREKKLSFLVLMVKNSAKFRQLDDTIVEKELRRRFNHHPSLWKLVLHKDEKHLMRNERVKKLVRGVRASLFPLFSLYYGKQAKKKYDLLKKLERHLDDENKVLEFHRELLNCHTSSRERAAFYEELYKDIFSITGKPQSLLDLGSGLNPVSLPFMHLENVKYTASDFSQKECDFLQSYFDIVRGKYHIDGKTICLDLLDDKDVEKLRQLPAVDVCFLFKVVDLLDRKRNKRSEKVLNAVNAQFIAASFSTRTISGEKMDRPTRKGFLLMLQRLGYKYNIIEKQNELFYVIKKS